MKLSLKYLILILIIIIHLIGLFSIPELIFPELLFPSWMISVSKLYVSEDHFLHPSMLYYIITLISQITGNFRLSINVLLSFSVILFDSILFFYLYKKFYKLAYLGLFFYIPWQIFFRGNSFWFDYITIPFLFFSFVYFSRFIKIQKINTLIISSIFLALGYLIKQTVIWFYFLFLAWIIFVLVVKKYNFKKIFCYFSYFLFPLVFAIFFNICLTYYFTKNLNYAFVWSFIMPLFIYSRLPNYSKNIPSEYINVILFLLSYYLLSIIILLKKSKNRLFYLFLSFTTIFSIANIFPRWSDFHMQPYIFFLTMILTTALSNIKNLNSKLRITIVTTILFLSFISIIIFANRIFIYKKTFFVPKTDVIKEYSNPKYSLLFKNKKVFNYDSPQYQGAPIENDYPLSFIQKTILIITDPYKYYRLTSPQLALEYIQNNKPDFLIITEFTKQRIDNRLKLVRLEKFIQSNYEPVQKLNTYYWAYKINN